MATLAPEHTQELINLMGSTTLAGEFIRKLRRMEHEAAARYIDDELSRASDDLKAGLLSLIPESLFEVQMPKGKQYAILWLCGATYGQIALIYGVRKETAQSSASRYLTPEVREEARQDRSKFTFNIPMTVVSAHRQILLSWLSNSDRFKLMTQGSVSRIATGILKEYMADLDSYTEAGSSAYDDIPVIDKRIGDEVVTSDEQPLPEPQVQSSDDQLIAFDKMFGGK